MSKSQLKEFFLASFINDMDKRFFKEESNRAYVDARRQLRIDHKSLVEIHGMEFLKRDWNQGRLKTGIVSFGIGVGIGAVLLALFLIGRVIHGWL